MAGQMDDAQRQQVMQQVNTQLELSKLKAILEVSGRGSVSCLTSHPDSGVCALNSSQTLAPGFRVMVFY